MLSTARLLSDRMARSGDERTRVLAPSILNPIDRAARLASDAIEYVRDRPAPRLAALDLADLVDEAGIALQEQVEESNPNLVRAWLKEIGEGCSARADSDLLYRVFINLGRNGFEAGATTVTIRSQNNGGFLLIDVADNGPGVPQAVAAQLFRPFTTGGGGGGAGRGPGPAPRPGRGPGRARPRRPASGSGCRSCCLSLRHGCVRRCRRESRTSRWCRRPRAVLPPAPAR